MSALEPAWIQYTSVTTSRPKAVVLTHANALWGAKVSATHETLTQGAEMLAAEIARFGAGEPLTHVLNPSAVSA